MSGTTFSFRIPPPLYGLQDVELAICNVADLPMARVTVTVVDHDRPMNVEVVASGSGSVTLPGDNFGMLHNTRLDVTVEGTVEDWMRDAGSREAKGVLTAVTNHLIDWYRYTAQQYLVRRIPALYIKAFEFTDGKRTGQSFMPGPLPGTRSDTAGVADPELVQLIRDHLRQGIELPLYLRLHCDAAADLLSGELHSAVLGANTALEVLANRGFRHVVRDGMSNAEIEDFFEQNSPSAYDLLRRINKETPTGISNTKLCALAETVRDHRNDVIHGNPVFLTVESVSAAIESLIEVIALVERGIAGVVAADL